MDEGGILDRRARLFRSRMGAPPPAACSSAVTAPFLSRSAERFAGPKCLCPQRSRTSADGYCFVLPASAYAKWGVAVLISSCCRCGAPGPSALGDSCRFSCRGPCRRMHIVQLAFQRLEIAQGRALTRGYLSHSAHLSRGGVRGATPGAQSILQKQNVYSTRGGYLSNGSFVP